MLKKIRQLARECAMTGKFNSKEYGLFSGEEIKE
jgi:hypothetical protein